MKKVLFLLLVSICNLTTPQAQEIKDFPGYFPFTYSEKDGRITLAIDKIGKEFLYVQGLSTGVGSNDLGLDRGQIGRERIVKFKRAANKILLVQPNYSYRALSSNGAERKSVEEAFAQSVLWGFPIDREENGILYIDLTPFLMQDVHDVSGRLESARQGSYRLDLSRSALNLERTRNFPKNTEFDVWLTFTGKATGQYIRSVTPSPEAVSVHQHHSFVELPDDGYQPRKFDPRSGYFETSYFDYATPISEPIKKMLTVRHRLEKKDPFAPFSEPVKPIVYYVDAGCPEPIKSALIEGASWWNEAFEAAGFINAFQVKEMPTDADPMDVRYNVIQWVHRSTRGWSYGNAVTDPRTGEIIKGHVSLGSLRVRQDYLIARGLASPFGMSDENNGELTQMALARLRQLSAHEVGHTLGLSHNYASNFNGRASVMDYPHPVVDFKDGRADFSNAYDVGIGEWDKRAILWGYADFPQGTDELKELDKIMNETIRLNLKYLTDQDSRPGGSAHPYSHLWDNGQSAVDELQRLLNVRRQALKLFGMNTLRNGEPMATLENVLVPLYLSHRYQLEATSKWIGGVEYNYAVKGDSQLITRVVPSEQQSLALNAVLKSISPAELSLPENIVKLIPPQPPGYDRDRENFKTNTGLPFDPLAAAESISAFALGFLVHPERMARIVEQNARNAGHWNLLSYIQNIHRGINSQPVTNGLEQEIKLNNERIFINKLLAVMADHNLASSVMSPCLRFIKLMESQLASSQSSQASYIIEMIHRYREDPSSFVAPEPSRMPDGAPIGCFQE